MVPTSPNPDPPGVGLIPLRKFRCVDANTDETAPCQKPNPNVILASTDYVADNDNVLRRIPMFVQPACLATGACDIPALNPLGFAAYRAWVLQGVDGPHLQE